MLEVFVLIPIIFAMSYNEHGSHEKGHIVHPRLLRGVVSAIFSNSARSQPTLRPLFTAILAQTTGR